MANNLKVGDRVSWFCIPRGGGSRRKPFQVSGVVRRLKESTFGSCIRKMGATLYVRADSRYNKVMQKRWAFVATDKLSKK